MHAGPHGWIPKNIRVGRCAWICPESKSDGQAKAWTPNVARTK